MKADPKVIDHLNTVLTNELTAINQYFLHARMLDHWGITKLGKHEYQESVEEMRHADSLIKRILFLDGLPNLQRLNALTIGQTAEEISAATCRWRKRRSQTCARRSPTARASVTSSAATCSPAFCTMRKSTSTSSRHSST